MFIPESLRALVLLALMLALSSASLAQTKFSFETTPGQLPKDVIPQHYAISLRPDMKALTLKGDEVIDVEVRKAVNTIVLNALELQISRASLVGEPGQAATVKLDGDSQTVSLTFPQAVKPGKHKLEIVFDGKIGTQSQGLYHVKYSTDQGEKAMLATQMEPTDARRMFPCWDEPVYRSTYQLTVALPQNFVAVSNMPIESEKRADAGLKTVTFGRTPRMSSYLVVLVAGELEMLTGESEGVQLHIVTTRGKKESGQYALETLKKILPYYNNYFGIKYPLPKLDLIAVPGGFGGAMENWGGITFQESILLFDPNTSSQDTKAEIFSVLSHEVAHQWFGDLVTMAWWDNLWLNEGFASWMGTKATDHFNPEWQVWLRESRYKNSVMSSDAQKTSHAIQRPVNNPTDAASVFDEITYGKGEAFIRMLETFLGEEQFRDGIRAYMQARKYSNTTTTDLWDALGRASGKPVSQIASGWTEQPGFPLVRVKSSCQPGGRAVTLEQERFTVNDPNTKPLQWQVPVSISYAGGTRAASYVLLSGQTMTVPAGSCDSVVKLNAGNVGYYRVKYEPEMLGELVKKLGQLSPADRLNLLGDTWAIAQAGQGSATAYLDLVEAVRDDASLATWEEVLDRLYSIDDWEIGEPGRARFHNYARSLLGPVFARVGWDARPGEDPTVGLLRNRLITALGAYEDKAVIGEARKRFQAFLQNPRSLQSDLREPVFYIVGRYSDRATYDQLHALGRQSQGTEEKEQLYKAMMGALDPKLGEENLRITLTDELPPEPAAYSIFTVASEGEHAEMALNFALQHMKELSAKLSSFSSVSYLPNLFTVFSEAARADELETYSKKNLSADARPEVDKAAEKIRFRAAFKQRELSKVDRWTSQHTR